jgi:tetratricopeptide (TPR) repeat protein
MDFQTAGFYTDATKTYKQAEVKGKLGEIQFIDTPEGDRTKAWDLRINKDSTQQLQSGYSGSPIFANNSEYVLGVASQLTGENKGLAISIEALKELWPERPDGLISSVTPSPTIQGNVTLVSSEHPERSRDLIPDFSEADIEADIEIMINDIINLNPHPNFYFWSSEGKDKKLSTLLDSRSVLRALLPSKLANLDYYLGLCYLQAGQYKQSIDRFKYFLSQVAQESPIALTTRVNLGKSYFYLADYNSALQQWNMFRRSASLLPSELKEYNMASVVWRESLIYGLPHNRNIELQEKRFHELCDLVDKVGVLQEKNLLFSTAYSYLIANEAEIGLKYANDLKDLLKNRFKNHLRQPMFMIAALFLEARCLSQLGDCDKAMSLTILLSLGNSFSSIDWEREIFMNNLIPGLSYQNLKATLVKQLKPRHIDYTLDNSKVYGDVNDDFRYAGAGRTYQNSRPFI